VWVGNAGKSGQRLLEHLQIFQAVVPRLKTDAVIVLLGINDLMTVLRDPEGYAEKADVPKKLAFPIAWTFYKPPLIDKTFPRDFPENLATWNLAHRVYTRLMTDESFWEDATAQSYVERRKMYRAAPQVITTLRLILATQPVIWSDSLSQEAERLLWAGIYGDYLDPKGRYEIDALATGMARYNRTLREVCARYGVECVDLAEQMNGVESYYYDDVHFTKLGSRKVAEIFAEYLRSTAAPSTGGVRNSRSEARPH
jgi:lysophospholipase L1-like esterase